MPTALDPDLFPSLRAAARRPERLDAAIHAIADGVAAGSIRNVVLKDAKDTISRAVDEGWKLNISDPYFYAGRYENQPSGVYEFYSSFLVMGLHDMLATSRKLAKTKLTGDAIDAMKAFTAEALPLAEAVASLKDKVIKGRAPNTAPSKPVNPNKVVKTCPCCFRAIAVVGGTMAHHGYERPGYGWQTASCPGIRFKPLEMSNEGLLWVISANENELVSLKRAYEARDTISSLPVQKGRSISTITPDDASWTRQLRYHVAKLESDMRHIEGTLRMLNERLAAWKPETYGK